MKLTLIIILFIFSLYYPELFGAERRIHVFVVTTEDVPDLEMASKVNCKMLKSSLQALGDSLQIPTVFHEMRSNVEKEKILSLIRSANMGIEDIAVFYYMGHAINGKKAWPILTPPSGSIAIEDIYEHIKTQNVGLSILIGECCNIGLAHNSNMSKLTESKQISVQPLPMFESKGLSILTVGASAGEASWFNMQIGSFFTYSFCQVLNEALSNTTQTYSWDSFLSNVSELTSKNMDVVGKKQHPIYLVEGQQ
jgi:hypothetical protein